MKIIHDMFEAIDLGCTTILFALDLSDAFHITDHSVLLSRFESSFGIIDPVLNIVGS